MPSERASSVVAFLFTDIVGSTQLTDTLGDEGAQDIVRLHNSLVRAEVARSGGSEVKTMGDGFMIAFPSASAALNCAVSIQRAISQHNQKNPTREFMVRMGINAGEAIQEEADFFGAAVIVAARINALAGGGEILISEAVKQLVQGMRGIEWKFKGEFQLKGLREAYRIYEVSESGQAEVLSLRRARFVGRERDLEALASCLDEASGGSGLLAVIGGEAGVGKTRLAEEAARNASARGFRVWRGRCSSTEGAPPYLPFIEMLRLYIEERPDDVLIDELGEEATEIARLVPELARRIPLRGETIPLPPEQERYRLLEAVGQLIASLARRRPMLLLLEDVHWADDASCLLLRHLARMVSGTSVIVLATALDREVAPNHPLSLVTAEFGRFQAYRHVSLSGLSVSEIDEILESLGGGAPPEGLAETIFQATEGNAFFVAELVSHLQASQLLLHEDGSWKTDFLTAHWDIPHSIRAVIQRRLASLDEAARRVLSVAAVVGKEFSYEVLDALEEVPADALLDALEEGARMGMIEQAGRAATQFRFTHYATQQTLYEEIPALRRQRSHLRIGEAMERSSTGGPEELAYHFVQAGTMASSAKTSGYMALAGEKARSMAAWEEAAEYFSRALTLADGIEPKERAHLLWRLGEAQSGKGDWESSAMNLRQAMDLYKELEDAETMAWIAYSLRRLYGARGQFAEASEVVQTALDTLGDVTAQVRSRLLAQAGFMRSAFGDVAEGEELLRQSMKIAEESGEAAAKGFSAFITGMHCLSYCRLAEAADWLSRAVDWALEGKDLWSASQASSFRRHILFTLGRPGEAEEAMDEEARLARKAGNFLAVCETKWISSSIACLRGDLERAALLGRELLQLIEAAHADSGIPGALNNLAYIQFLSGDLHAYEELLARALVVYDKMSAAPIDDPRPVLVLLRALSARTADAQALMPDLERYFHLEDPWTTSMAEARITLAAGLAVLGETDGARRLYAPLKEWTASAGYVLTGASSIPQLVSRALGMTASAIGLNEEAVTHFEAAISQATEMTLDAELAECHYWYAKHLLEAATPAGQESGRGHLERAVGIWQAAGMYAQAERADALSRLS